MNNKALNFLLFCVLWLTFSAVTQAQEGATTLASGVTVAIKRVLTPNAENGNPFGNTHTYTGETMTGDVIHRVMVDSKNKLYFGYDLEVIPHTEKGKFKVSIRRLSVKPNRFVSVEIFAAQSLPKYPADVVVSDGNMITLDILENPQTQAKVSDLIKITTEERKLAGYFTEFQPAKDFTLDDVQLRLDAPEILVNDTRSKIGGGAAGNVVWVSLKGKGRFIFSFVPQPGNDFQKIGVIEYNKISFDFDGDKYQFIGESPVISPDGRWNLWVMFDAEYKPNLVGRTSFGAADKVKHLFDRKSN